MKTVLLCDYGLDDACATLKVLQERREGETVDIVAVGGNDSAQKSLTNAIKLLGLVGNPSWVTLVDTTAIPQNHSYLPSIHGEDSMGDLTEYPSDPVTPVPFDEWLRDVDSHIRLVSLGPCKITNLILDRIGEPDLLLIMAGNVAEEPNYEGYEFNHRIDISAFEQCVKHPHVIATLDSCRTAAFNFSAVKHGESGELSRFLDRSVELAKQRHPDNSYVYDYICVSYLYEPQDWDTVSAVDADGNRLNMLKHKD